MSIALKSDKVLFKLSVYYINDAEKSVIESLFSSFFFTQ